jgi:aminoglycoside 3-N-acetyltransferase
VDQTAPHTAATLAADLRALGVASGDVVLVHASTRRIGFVAGGPQAIVEALLAAVGEAGTIVVPTHTPDNTDPASWRNPPVPQAWWPVIREGNPGYDRQRTPSHWMGVVAETVRTWPGSRRSGHPHYSFTALGARAAEIARGHALDSGLGDRSPLGAVYRLAGRVLLLGVGHDTNTSLHLAEWRQPAVPMGVHAGAVRHADGRVEWLTWTDVLDQDNEFPRVGADFEATGAVRVGPVGSATARLMDQRALVDFATTWMAQRSAAA